MAPIRIDGTQKHDTGKGLIANVDIPGGVQIVVEKPLFRVKTSFLTDPHTELREFHVRRELTNSFDQHTVKNFLRLNNGRFWTVDFKDTPFSGTIIGSAIPLSLRDGYNGSDESFNTRLGAEQIYTLREIQANEELTISYVPDAAINRQYLKDTYEFDCNCNWCHQPREVQIKSQGRLSTIDSLDEYLLTAVEANDMVGALQLGCEVLNLMGDGEIRDYRLGVTYQTLFDVVVKQGDKRKAKFFATHAYIAFEFGEGSESPAILQLEKKLYKFWGFENVVNGALGQMIQLVKQGGYHYLGYEYGGNNIFTEEVLDDMFARTEWKPDGRLEEFKGLREAHSLKDMLNEAEGDETIEVEVPNMGGFRGCKGDQGEKVEEKGEKVEEEMKSDA